MSRSKHPTQNIAEKIKEDFFKAASDGKQSLMQNILKMFNDKSLGGKLQTVGVGINSKNEFDQPALVIAARDGQVSIVNDLLKQETSLTKINMDDMLQAFEMAEKSKYTETTDSKKHIEIARIINNEIEKEIGFSGEDIETLAKYNYKL